MHSHLQLRQLATLCNIAEELRCYILSFLSYTEIIRCASTCKMMYKMVQNSTELQYLIELGSQGLMSAHPRPTISITVCLRILRDKAKAWSSFELSTTKRLRVPWFFDPTSITITHQQLSLSVSYRRGDVSFISKLIDISTCTPESAGVPPRIWNDDNTSLCYRYLDETQDLFITVYMLSVVPYTPYSVYQINFRTISMDKEHPLAHEPHTELTCRVSFSRSQLLRSTTVAVLGDRLAFYCHLNDPFHPCWSLHVWSWCEGGQPKDTFGECYTLSKIRFLTKEKLLALTSHGYIETYNVENLSNAPQLQARFMLPFRSPQSLWLRCPSVFHSVSNCMRLTEPDERWIWTTNPANRVICVMSSCPWSIFVIRANLFFMDIPPTWFDVNSKDGLTVPWSSWGPQNSRCFLVQTPVFGVGGSRIIRPAGIRMHMADFNPSAVARGIGKVVREPTVIPTGRSRDSFTEDVTTYLPYVEVVNNDREFDNSLWDIRLDEEKALIFTRANTEHIMGIEIIDM